MANMWKYITRNLRETFERRICSSLTDSSGQDKNSTCILRETFLPTIHRFCVKQNAPDQQRRWGPSDEKKEEKSYERTWNDAYARHSWFGAVGWSTAIVLSWNLLQPLCRLQYAQENKEQHHTWSSQASSSTHWRRPKEWHLKQEFGSQHRPSHWQFTCPRSRKALTCTDGTLDSGHHSHEKGVHKSVRPPDNERPNRWHFACPLSRRFHEHKHGVWDSGHNPHNESAPKSETPPDDEWDSGHHSLEQANKYSVLNADSIPLPPPTESINNGVWKFITQKVWAHPNRIIPKPAKLEIDYVSVGESAVKYGPSTAEQALDDATEKLIEAQNSVMGDIDNKLGVELMQQGKHHEAVSRFSRAIGFKNASAAYNLGVCHEMGLGTNQDFKEAAKYYQIASDKGHPTAMYNLGVFYVHGWGGLSSDSDEAHKLFERASTLGQQDAKKALDMVKMNDVPQPPPLDNTESSLDLVQQALEFVQDLGLGFQQDIKQSERVNTTVDHKDISDMVHDSILKYTYMLQK